MHLVEKKEIVYLLRATTHYQGCTWPVSMCVKRWRQHISNLTIQAHASPRYGSSNAIRGAAMAKKAAAVLAAKGSANLFKFVLKKSDTSWLQMLGIQNMLEPGGFVDRPSFCAVVCDFLNTSRSHDRMKLEWIIQCSNLLG